MKINPYLVIYYRLGRLTYEECEFMQKLHDMDRSLYGEGPIPHVDDVSEALGWKTSRARRLARALCEGEWLTAPHPHRYTPGPAARRVGAYNALGQQEPKITNLGRLLRRVGLR